MIRGGNGFSEKHALGLDPGDHAPPENESANRFNLKRLRSQHSGREIGDHRIEHRESRAG